MSLNEDFLCPLFKFLTNGVFNINHNILKIHSRKLEENGDVSFPLNFQIWKKILKTEENCNTILDYLFTCNKRYQNVSCKDILLKESKNWPICLENCIFKDNAILFLQRAVVFKLGIQRVLKEGHKFGSSHSDLKIAIEMDDIGTEMNLSELRMKILREVTGNLVNFIIGDCNNSKECKKQEITDVRTLRFTLKSNNLNTTYCGPVLDSKNSKKHNLSVEEFRQKRSLDMRLMAEHKYGLRITSQPGWKEIFKKLGDAAVKIELLSNKPNSPILINLSDNSVCRCKTSSFILYNCARISTLLREFDKKSELGIYPPLPIIEVVDFSLLKEPEEWELMYVYIMQFPLLLKSSLRDILKGRININYLISALSHMVQVFSIYYRRIRVLIVSFF